MKTNQTTENEKYMPARIRISDIPTLKSLDRLGAKLADAAGDYHRSAILRRLIPPAQVSEALAALSETQRGMASKDFVDLLHECFAENLINRINTASKYSIDPLVKFLTKGTIAREKTNKICEIFTKWQRAIAEVDDYTIEVVVDFEDGVKLSSYVVYCEDPDAAEYDTPIEIESMRVGVRKVIKKDFIKENKKQEN